MKKSSLVGKSIYDLDTPCLMVDLDIVDKNIKRMSDICRKAGVSLRPHIKTHKTVEIAKMQLSSGACGISVAKVSEAEVFAKHGIRSIFIAYPVAGAEKFRRLLALKRNGGDISVGVDNLVSAKSLSEIFAKGGERIDVMVEVNLGLDRSGVRIDGLPSFVAQIIGFSGLRLKGIFGFRSIFYNGGKLDFHSDGLREGAMMMRAYEDLRKMGVEMETVSAGSSPTAKSVSEVKGITEVRPGTYVFNDVMEVKTGVVDLSQCAASVLCTIVSKPKDGVYTVDGGTKTFAGDVSPDQEPLFLNGYGAVHGNQKMVLKWMNEEHGIVEGKEEASKLEIGDKIRIIPNHICTVVNLFDEMVTFRKDTVEAKWKIAARGKRT